MDKLNFLLAIHCHQPVSNFGIVFSQAYEQAYLPFIEVLERHPGVNISLHYSGALLDWFKDTHPKFLKRIKKLVKTGQVEILAGGYYEPILSLIPQSDAQEQIQMLRKRIKDSFSYNASGCWLTERVWEPNIPSILNSAGIDWTIVDDSHFKSAGLKPQELSGYYVSEENAKPLAVFPASEKLRYFIPFKTVEQGLEYLKDLNEDPGINCVCYADDGEKFGHWPGTNKWVFEERWLDNFFTALEQNSSWLKTQTFSQYMDENSPTDRIYLNCASYREMMEWSGGYYRNFLLKYEEANWMHKRMLKVSRQLNDLTAKLPKQATSNKAVRISEAKKLLYMAQTNDAYWHGVFGGLYLNHLRSSIYSNLIEAEKLINNSNNLNLDTLDLDCDGRKEIVISSGSLNCVFSPHRGASLMELDYKPKSVNIINTLRRRQEGYHQKIKQNLVDAGQNQSQPQSIHDVARIKQGGIDERSLVYDLFPRHCCLDHFLERDITLDEFCSCKYEELGDFTQGQYSLKSQKKTKASLRLEFFKSGSLRQQAVKVKKRVSLCDNNLTLNYTIKNTSSDSLRNLFGIEFNFSVYDKRLSLGANCKHHTDYFQIRDIWNQINLEFKSSKPGSVWHFPVQTVSDSENGIEKSYQELCVFFNWPLDIITANQWELELKLSVKNDEDKKKSGNKK